MSIRYLVSRKCCIPGKSFVQEPVLLKQSQPSSFRCYSLTIHKTGRKLLLSAMKSFSDYGKAPLDASTLPPCLQT